MQKRVLIIRLSALGDVAMTLPVIYNVARANAADQFVLLTRPFFARLFLSPPSNLRVIAYEKGKMSALLRRLATERFTHVADLHNVLRSWRLDLWALLRGKRVAMVDKARGERRKILRRKGYASKSFIERYYEVFARLGLSTGRGEVANDAERIAPKSAVRTLAAPLQIAPASRFGASQPIIALAPFARYTNKTYPLELSHDLVRLLTSRGYHVLLFGGGDRERTILEQWAAEIYGCESRVGKQSIEEELVLMASAQCLVSMDSANGHLASLVGTRVITLWGSTTPACGFAPYGQSPDDSLCASLPCQPCTIAGSEQCPRDLACLRALTPQQILDCICQQ